MRPFRLDSSAVRLSSLPPGGDEEVRTPDPLRARQVLSQLSYTPVSWGSRIAASSLFEVPFPWTFKIKQYSFLRFPLPASVSP